MIIHLIQNLLINFKNVIIIHHEIFNMETILVTEIHDLFGNFIFGHFGHFYFEK